MITSQSIKTINNFFDFHLQIYQLCKKFDFYDKENFNARFKTKQNWPGLRTWDLSEMSPFLFLHVLSCLNKNNIDTSVYRDIKGCCHVRFERDEENDWIHRDPCDTVIIYLSDTNINSGTKFYDDTEKHEISRINFIQNTCLFFEKPLPHRSFGSHGNEIDNSRMTLNFFMHR